MKANIYIAWFSHLQIGLRSLLKLECASILKLLKLFSWETTSELV